MVLPRAEFFGTPQERQQISRVYAPGVARFAAGPQFWDPTRRNYQPEAVYRAVRESVAVDHYLGPVSAISLNQRSQVQSTRQQWTQGMIDYFSQVDAVARNNPQSATAELREILRNQFHIDVGRNDLNYFQQRADGLWNRYLQNGSDLYQFITDAVQGVGNSEEEYARRIAAVQDFMHIFGGDETVILTVHAAMRRFVAGNGGNLSFAQWATGAINQPFTSPVEEHAYELLWEQVRDQQNPPQGPNPVQPNPNPQPILPPRPAPDNQPQHPFMPPVAPVPPVIRRPNPNNGGNQAGVVLVEDSEETPHSIAYL